MPAPRPRLSSNSKTKFPPASAGERNVGCDVPRPKTGEIACLAYAYWEARGCQGGSAEEDWFRAEAELRGILGKRLVA
jgi:hypothetical protein